jgi:phospholipase/carboxylesterase
MVNKFFKTSAAAAIVAALTSVSAFAQVELLQPEAASGNAAFIKKSDIMTPAPGAGVTMRHPKTDAAETAKDVNKVVKEAISRSQKFVYHFTRPENGSGETIVLLHGSGGNETSLVPFAQKVWPRATLLGIRGRVLQEGRTRWYARITPVKFDQNDVRHEADAFVSFLTKLSEDDQIDLSRTTFVGYSNGANLLAATMMLHPDLVKKAVLMRSMPVLDHTPVANLSKAKVLVVTGADDKMYAPFAPALSDLLRTSGAKVDARVVQAGHMIGDRDVSLVTAWLSGQGPDGAPAMSQAVTPKAKDKADTLKALPDAQEPATQSEQALEQSKK